jgi:hypothetical protein
MKAMLAKHCGFSADHPHAERVVLVDEQILSGHLIMVDYLSDRLPPDVRIKVDEEHGLVTIYLPLTRPSKKT